MNNGYDPLELLSIRDIARILKRNEATVRGYIKDYKLNAIKHREGYKGAKKIYLTRQELERFIYTGYNNI